MQGCSPRGVWGQVWRGVCGWLGEQDVWRRAAAAVGRHAGIADDGLRARWAAYGGLLGLAGLVSVCWDQGGRGGQEWRRRMTRASEWLCSFALVCLAAWQHGGIAACPARALRQTAPEKPSALQPAVHGVRAGGRGLAA
jgi:hypothetical protein